MKYTTVKDLVWTKDQTGIDCIVNFDLLGEIPFTASLNDLPYSVEIYNRCISGEFGPIADYVPYIDEGDNPQSTGPIPEYMRIPVTNTNEVL
jgi:hypothetical protein